MNEKKSVGLAVASMVLGIVSLLFGCCFWYVTIPAAVIAVILAAISISKHMGGKGMAISGLVTGIISLVPAIIIMITGSSLMTMVSDDDDAKSKKDISMSSVSDESDSFSHDEKEKSNVSDSKEKTTVKIVDYSLSTDYEGKDIVLVDFEFYNGEDKNINFSTKFSAAAFQNGVECDSIVIMGLESDTDLTKVLNDVQPGASYTVTKAYKLNDMSDAEIIVTGWLSDKEYLKETISFE